ncbi:hypothetical protein [Haloarchaeobius litoreus]|uniref:Uncharacterized protein n=1 Tax=Haloarchaeobius litoreus TaxID=755306 RepID=A0ABD6DGT5_9EURY|nr:hypothetical protein [Haloarchaeobius litoreus]
MEYLPTLREYCEFGPERVYLLLALARSKENDDGEGPSAIRKVVCEEADLEPAVAELDHAVSRFDATYRLYLTANARNTRKALFALRRSMDDWLEARLNGSEDVLRKFGRVDGEFTSTLQSDGCRDETNFVFDLDDATAADADALAAELREWTTLHLRRETPNGFHLVTEPFDYNALDVDVEFELKTDGLVFVAHLGE